MIFVTGGTGLVGSHVLLELIKNGHKCVALKRKTSALNICKRVFNFYKSDQLFSKINWYDGDINNIPSLQRGMSNCDLIIHCAAVVSFNTKDKELIKKINIEGTANVVNVALSLGVKKMCYVSSIATLGKSVNNELIDENSQFKFSSDVSFYAKSKYYAEQEVWRGSLEGLDVVIINPSVILGPGDWSKGSSQIFQKIYTGLKFYSPGSTGYVDVVDVSTASVKLLFSNIKNERFIINGVNISYRNCFNKIAVAMGKSQATIKVTPLLKEIAWRIEAIKAFVFNTNPLLTRETANTAMKQKKFSSEKIINKLKFTFTDFDTTINKYSKWFIADLK